MKLNRWNWGYVPVAVVLGLIWYEFWRSGAFVPPPARPASTQEAVPGAAVGESKPPEIAVPGAGARVTVLPAAPEPVKPEPVMNDAFLNNPPPISLRVANASPDMVVEELRKALGKTCHIQLETPNSNPNVAYNLDVKNVPFWEVIKALEAQAPMGMVQTDNIGNGMEGLVLNPQSGGIFRFQTNGPAMLYASNITFSKSGTGLLNAGVQGNARYSLTLGTAVDPRIKVTRYYPVTVTGAVDETGRNLAIPTMGNSPSDAPTNYWQSSISFTALEPRAKKATFQCQVRFVAQLSETTVTVEDATQKAGQSITLGDRSLRLVRCEVQANRLYIQIAEDAPQPQGQPIAFTLVDANGKSNSMTVQSTQTTSVSLVNYVAPYRLVFRSSDRTRELTFPFELKDVPLP